jgi:hypothetical protein
MFHIYEISSLDAPIALVRFARHQEALSFFRDAVGSLKNLSGNLGRFLAYRERCLKYGVRPTRIFSANGDVYAVGFTNDAS